MAIKYRAISDNQSGAMRLANEKSQMLRTGQTVNTKGQVRIESTSTPPKDKERGFEKSFNNNELREKKYQGLSGYPDKVCRVVINQSLRGHGEGFYPNV